MHISRNRKQKGDEESLLPGNDPFVNQHYGAVLDSPTASAAPPSHVHHRRHVFTHLQEDDASSRGNSEVEESGTRNNGEEVAAAACRRKAALAERKRRRMHRHHHADSSAQMLLPNIMRGKKSKKKGTSSSNNNNNNSSNSSSRTCSDQEDNDDSDNNNSTSEKSNQPIHPDDVFMEGDDLSRIATADLVLPALDPRADEVIATAASQRSLDQWFKRRSNVNFSTVRTKYRASRKSARDEKTEVYSLFNSARHYFHWHPFVSRIRSILLANQTIVLFVYIDFLVDLLFCLAYTVEMKEEFDVNLTPPWMYKWRSYDLWFFCQVLTFWNLGSFLIRIFLTGHPISVLISFRSLIEMVTTVPFLSSNFMEHGQLLYVPYFLRSWVLLLRIKSAMKIKTNLQMTDKPVDLLKSKLIHLICTLMVLLYNGMAAFQFCEATFANVNYSILDSLYFVMVTLSTVGYGDMTVQTEGGRVVVMLIILTSLAVLPSLVTDVLATNRKRNEGGGHVSSGSMPFILIVGAFRLEQVNEILDGFLNRENAERHLNVVFLDINRPPDDLKLLERNSMWGHRIQFLHGSVLNEKTLQRVRARYAKAIFTISDQNAKIAAEEDERNTVRLWSLYCYTVSHKIPIYSYNLSPSTAIYQKVAKEIICVREFKQYLLAMNCRCRGVSTMITNLLHQRQPTNRYDEPWQAQYDDGSCNEIYTQQPAPYMVDMDFGHIAWMVFKECQVILFAIKTYAADRDEYEILLNPSNDYIIKKEDLCVYISESPKEIKDIEYLNPSYVTRTINRMRTMPLHMPMPQQQWLSNLQQQQPPMPNSATTTPSHPPSSTHAKPPPERYKLSRLPTPRHALLTGSRALISRLGQSPVPHAHHHTLDDDSSGSSLMDDVSLPLSYVLEERVDDVDKVTITSAANMRGHILVCVHREVVNIFKFIYNLRSPHMRPEALQDIVILCATPPKPKTFELISMFPKVYFIVGDCRQPDDLLKAGVKRAKQVVVMSEKDCLDECEYNSDSPAIMTSHIIDLLVQERAEGAYTIVNLVEKSNIRFMHLLQEKDVAEEIDVFYTPAYAAGDVIADSLINNVLLSQTYYKPDIVSIIKTLCGMPGPLLDGSAAHLMSSSQDFSTVTSAMIHAPHLTSIPMPPEFIDHTFAFMFETLLLGYGIMPLGLLRAADDSLGNELPFVYTNPVPSLILKATDQVYILSSPQLGYC